MDMQKEVQGGTWLAMNMSTGDIAVLLNIRWDSGEFWPFALKRDPLGGYRVEVTKFDWLAICNQPGYYSR